MTKNGISTTKNLGEEAYQIIELTAFPNTMLNKTFVQYDYRHTDGELFSTVAKSLEICRQRRDNWLKEKENKKELEQ